ncbi:MAG: MBOAT family O-acyltransferase [Ruminococcus callidus]|nr:MBOAT family protein [Ruminococcus sp.]MDY6145576.1 MBOAT family O-acyltransferase [Ruminococcus callidus]
MSFTTIEFMFRFLPIFLIVYYVVPTRYKNLILLIGSFVFYAWGQHFYLLLLMLSIVVNYTFGRLIGERRAQRKPLLILGLIYNFGLLVFFKYTNFFIENINALLTATHVQIPTISVVMPLGISFYTFQVVSYLVDVYRGEQRPVKNIINLGVYIAMFPQVTSGPIGLYSELEPTLLRRHCSVLNLESGLKTFILGMGAKMLLANPMGTLWAGMSRYGYETLSCPYAWLGAFGYSFQLYFDFAGYSLMAMGLGQMLGLYVPRNFDHPYISGSMAEFWRRWHMTLGRWFKKYLYFPLGGSRCSFAKTIRNTFVVWAFTGLWHGASWNFVLWGLIFFVLLTIERLGLGKLLAKTKVLKHIYVIFLIPLTWVVFALPNMQDIGTYFSRLFPFFADNTASFVNTKDVIRALHDYWYLLIACVVFCLPFPSRWYEKHKNSKLVILGLVLIYLMSVYKMQTQTSNPFLYYQF